MSARTPWRWRPFTNRIAYLEDGDWAIDRRARACSTKSGPPVARPVQDPVRSPPL
jgi:hypothetical protein